ARPAGSRRSHAASPRRWFVDRDPRTSRRMLTQDARLELLALADRRLPALERGARAFGATKPVDRDLVEAAIELDPNPPWPAAAADLEPGDGGVLERDGVADCAAVAPVSAGPVELLACPAALAGQLEAALVDPRARERLDADVQQVGGRRPASAGA